MRGSPQASQADHSWANTTLGGRRGGSVEVGVEQGRRAQLDLETVGVPQVNGVGDPQIGAPVLDAGGVEPLLERVELLRRHGDGEVLDPTEGLVELGVLVAGEVEEREEVPVPDVEEEVRAALVVAVLEDLDEREPEQVLVEGDRRVDVGADE